MRFGTGTWLALLVVLGGFALYVTMGGEDERLRPDPGNGPLVALGKLVYGQHCASCHGAAMEGQANWRERKPDGRLPAPPHGVDGHTWHHGDDQLVAMTREGIAPFAPAGYVSDMPAFKDVLSEREIVGVIAYIKSGWPQEIRQRQAAVTARERTAR